MKKIFILFCICLSACVFFITGQASISQLRSCKIYFVDRQMHRLIPTEFETSKKSPEKIAQEIINSILIGKDYNNQILRIIPNIENSITVKVKKDTAYVNLSEELTQYIPKNSETEKLVIY